VPIQVKHQSCCGIAQVAVEIVASISRLQNFSSNIPLQANVAVYRQNSSRSDLFDLDGRSVDLEDIFKTYGKITRFKTPNVDAMSKKDSWLIFNRGSTILDLLNTRTVETLRML
jgi:hypothetical protein